MLGSGILTFSSKSFIQRSNDGQCDRPHIIAPSPSLGELRTEQRFACFAYWNWTQRFQLWAHDAAHSRSTANHDPVCVRTLCPILLFQSHLPIVLLMYHGCMMCSGHRLCCRLCSSRLPLAQDFLCTQRVLLLRKQTRPLALLFSALSSAHRPSRCFLELCLTSSAACRCPFQRDGDMLPMRRWTRRAFVHLLREPRRRVCPLHRGRRRRRQCLLWQRDPLHSSARGCGALAGDGNGGSVTESAPVKCPSKNPDFAPGGIFLLTLLNLRL